MRAPNTPAGLKKIKRFLAKKRVRLIVIEATGKFHRLAQRHLHAAGYAVAVVNPLFVRLFAQSMGQFAKTDRLDARVLAIYGATIAPKARPPQPQTIVDLQEILSTRAAAVEERTAIINRRKAAQGDFVRKKLQKRIAQIEAHIDELEAEIMKRVKADSALLRRYELLESIPGIGMVAALSLCIGLPELGACTGKAASLLAGLAPLADDSGKYAGERHIKGGRALVRTGLYFAALTATTWNKPLKAFHERLIANGKEFKVALTAVMRKLVELANVLIKEDRPWTPVHA